MDKIRVLSEQELKFVVRHLRSIRNLSISLLELLDPIEYGLDETPKPEELEKHVADVETPDGIQCGACWCRNKD